MDVTTPSHPRAATEGGDGAPGAVAPRRPGTMRRWLGRLVSLVATLAVVGIAALAAALTVVPALVGGHTLTVLSGSMVPEFAPGAMVVDKPAPAALLRVGDVITYATTDEVSGAPILITHRIVQIRAGAGAPTFITRGDANDTPDNRPVGTSQVRGKVWYSVPYVGTARNFLLAKGTGLILGGAAGLIASVWFLLRLLRAPEIDQEASSPSPSHGGRHRAGNTAMATVLLGMLVIAGHPVTERPATYAHFSDQKAVQFQIAVEGTTP